MDIVYCVPIDFEYLKSILNSVGYIRNGNVVSIEFKNFQIDFIYVKPIEYECANNYFSYNDMGNLLGRVIKQLGFKLSFKGLRYAIRNEHTIVKDIVIDYDWKIFYHILIIHMM